MKYLLSVYIISEEEDPSDLLERLQEFAMDLSDDDALVENTATVEDVEDVEEGDEDAPV